MTHGVFRPLLGHHVVPQSYLLSAFAEWDARHTAPVPKARAGEDGTAATEGTPSGRETMPERTGLGIEDTRVLHQQDKAHVPLFKEYHAFVDTNKNPRSFMHGDVFIQIIGNRGKTGLLHLSNGFKAASRNEFSIFAKDVGRVEKIRLAADTTDLWHCDRVWVVGPEGNREFPVGAALGWPNNPEMTVGPLFASCGPLGVLLAIALSAAQQQTIGRASAWPSPTRSDGVGCATTPSCASSSIVTPALVDVDRSPHAGSVSDGWTPGLNTSGRRCGARWSDFL